ncbi:hypothetical protein AB0O28_31525 [Microbispora sp. NPDC088329]
MVRVSFVDETTPGGRRETGRPEAGAERAMPCETFRRRTLREVVQ